MKEVFGQVNQTIQYPNDHPFLNGAWRPVDRELTVTGPDLRIEGEIPRDLAGVYLRNSHNPVHEPMGRYHPYDGDGMLHAMRFQEGRAEYRNRFIRTTGFLAEQAAGCSLWPGLTEPRKARRRGWGAIGAMKDNAGTDVIVHAGKAIAAMSQCSEPYRLDPISLDTLGPCDSWSRTIAPRGICSHFKLDEHTGDMMFFNFGEEPPYFNYGVVDRHNALVHYVPIELPGPRWPHDLGFTEHYSIIHDLPLFFDPGILKKGGHRLHFHRDIPSRFGIIPRLGAPHEIRWFEASPCYILHLANCYEDGDEIVMDGCIQTNPLPDMSALPREGYSRMVAMLDMVGQGCRIHRWRFDMRTGHTREEFLDDQCTEFPMVSGWYGGRPYRYSYNTLLEPGFWALTGLKKYDHLAGRSQTFELPPGCTLSETTFAPRLDSQEEDDGYLITFITNLNTGKGECAIFDARDITPGPIARVVVPQQIPNGAHAFWAPASTL